MRCLQMLGTFPGRLSEGTECPSVLQDSGTSMAIAQWGPSGCALGVDRGGGCTASSASGAAAAGHGGDEPWSSRRRALTPGTALGITRELVLNWWVMPTHSGSVSVPPISQEQVCGAGGWGAGVPQRWCLLGGSGSRTVPCIVPPHAPLAMAAGELCRQRRRGT